MKHEYEQYIRLIEENYFIMTNFINDNDVDQKKFSQLILWKGGVGFKVEHNDKLKTVEDWKDYNRTIKKQYLNKNYLSYDEWFRIYKTPEISDKYSRCIGCGLEGQKSKQIESLKDYCSTCGIFEEK